MTIDPQTVQILRIIQAVLAFVGLGFAIWAMILSNRVVRLSKEASRLADESVLASERWVEAIQRQLEYAERRAKLRASSQ